MSKLLVKLFHIFTTLASALLAGTYLVVLSGNTDTLWDYAIFFVACYALWQSAQQLAK